MPELNTTISLIRTPDKVPSSPLAKAEMAFKGMQSLPYFIKHMLGYNVPAHYATWENDLNSGSRLCFLAHRTSSKTIFFSVCYPLWRMFRGDLHEILVVGYETGEAERRVGILKEEIENNPWLQYLQNRGVWGQTRFKTSPVEDVNNGIEVSAMGIGSVKRGRHPDLIILDDIYNEKTSNTTPLQIKFNFYNVISPMPPPNKGKLIIVGTPISFDDLYSELKENDRYVYREYPALNEDGEPFWPEYWTKEALMALKAEINDYAFEREMMLRPISSEMSYFKYKYIEAAMRTRARLGEPDPDARFTVIGVDFAFSEAKRADYTVITVVSLVGASAKVVDVWRAKGVDDLVISDILSELTKRYKADLIVAEDTGQQIAIVRVLQRKGHFIKTLNTNRYTKNSILSNLNFEFQKRRIVLPAKEDDTFTMDYVTTLVEELSAFMNKENKVISVGKHDDTVMSLAFAIYYITKVAAIDLSLFSNEIGSINEADLAKVPTDDSGIIHKDGETFWVDDDIGIVDMLGSGYFFSDSKTLEW
jgi:hypothetical protein